MASIFTYDPDPPRVSSPWDVHDSSVQEPAGLESKNRGARSTHPEFELPCPASPISRLEPEPQEGPTEYKLHLLLRPRRSFTVSSTGRHVGGSHQPTLDEDESPPAVVDSSLSKAAPSCSIALAASNQSRQNRLQQLTTQLLWRLQQSSPNHSTSTQTVVLPILPDVGSSLEASVRPGRLLPGLEESSGALYEIGVSDDGRFVGLIKDEMEESLNNLRVMAASLGCDVEILRMVTVGDCQWKETVRDGSSQLHLGKLWVAEALVKPSLRHLATSPARVGPNALALISNTPDWISTPESNDIEACAPTTQLRISLTGATTSGKSSLLGTLSTATLDNGRGKSRLSLLKHRHEMASGVTSSIAHELVGYKACPVDSSRPREVVNFASGNVSSWTDIHAKAEAGRLIFFSDSAGHPRYRRTTVRGLVGSAPHWAILCVAADEACSLNDGHDVDAKQSPRTPGHAGPYQAHLDLCLTLRLSLIIVFTKLDRASKPGLRQALGRVLSALKAAGRVPVVLPTSSGASDVTPDPVLSSITHADQVDARRATDMIDHHGADVVVPILLTSAVTGAGICTLHALLASLPCPSTITGPRRSCNHVLGQYSSLEPVFHVEEIFSLPASTADAGNDAAGMGFVVSGHLRSGQLRSGQIGVGDCLLIGPYAIEAGRRSSAGAPQHRTQTSLDSAYQDSPPTSSPLGRVSPPPKPSSLGAFSSLDADHPNPDREWYTVRVLSVRNLRLPVRQLLADQVGTIGFIGESPSPILTCKSMLGTSFAPSAPNLESIRRGMILTSASATPSSSGGLTARINVDGVSSLALNSIVVLYFASVRVSARVTSVQAYSDASSSQVFPAETTRHDSPQLAKGNELVTFRFLSSREWIERGAQILVMPEGNGVAGHGSMERNENGGGAGGRGTLKGFAGRIVDVDV
ncbi:MAG: hypothetical protein M1817_002188 [Caeruleum heppii]|nr:MAG: hypothetical protein M1817_002188 [Caeruleum heppii]